jgi:hypothetical protein
LPDTLEVLLESVWATGRPFTYIKGWATSSWHPSWRVNQKCSGKPWKQRKANTEAPSACQWGCH